MPPKISDQVTGSITVPAMRLHASSGQARVTLNGRDFYLGKWGSASCASKYQILIEQHLASGRRWPRRTADGPAATLDEIFGAYLAFAGGYYQKGERATRTVNKVQNLLKLLRLFGLGPQPPARFSAPVLTSFRDWLAGDPAQPFARATINAKLHQIRHMFRWAAAEGLCDVSIAHDLTVVRGIPKGRRLRPSFPLPRESKGVEAVPEQDLAATLNHAGAVLRAMIDLQLLTGMRPTELCHMHADHILPCNHPDHPGIYAYRVASEANKLDHKDLGRTVFLGPRSMAILAPFLTAARMRTHQGHAAGYLFRPADAIEEHRAALREARTTPLYPSHTSEARRARKPRPPAPQKVGAHYTTDSYRRAIERACARAGLPRERWWSPNQLRHSAALAYAQNESLLAAQSILGHADIKTTMIYLPKQAPAAAIAAAERRA